MAAASSPPALPLPCIDLDLDLDDEEEEMAKKQVVEAEVDHLCRLPDEVVVMMVNKLLHLKTLLRFSLMAKRYSSLASQTDSVVMEFSSLRRTSPTAVAAGIVGRMCGFLKNMVAKLTTTSASTEPEQEEEEDAGNGIPLTQKFSAITHRFQQIKHLYLHLPRDIGMYKYNPSSSSSSSSSSASVKPKPQALGRGRGTGMGNANGMFSSSVSIFGSHLELSLFLVADSVNRFNPNTTTNTPPGSRLGALWGYWLEGLESILRTSSRQHVIISALASECKMIETAMFSDGSGAGALLMRKPHISKLRANMEEASAHPAPGELRVVVYHVSTLDLPQTGYTLNYVILVSAMPPVIRINKILCK